MKSLVIWKYKDRGCIKYINAEALHGGLIWESCFHFSPEITFYFIRQLSVCSYCCTHCNSCSGLSGIQQLMVQGLLFGVLFCVIVLYIQTQIWWQCHAGKQGGSSLWHNPSPLHGARGKLCCLDIPFYFMGWRNLSINHVCSIKLLSHSLNYSSTMLFNPLVRAEVANAHTKRICLFISVLALISSMLHYFSVVLIFSLIHIFISYHVAQNNNRVVSYIGETGKKPQINWVVLIEQGDA